MSEIQSARASRRFSLAWRVPAAVMTVILLLGACASGKDTTAGTGASAALTGSAAPCPAGVKKIGFAPTNMQAAYFINVARFLKEQASKCGVEIVVIDPANDAQKQVNGIDNALSAGVQAIVLSAVDPAAAGAIIANAKRASVPVIGLNSVVEGMATTIGLAEEEYGRLSGVQGGEWLKANKPGKRYKVAVLNADLLGPNLIARGNGLLVGLKSVVGDNFDVVANQGSVTEVTALAAVETILTSQPGLDLIMAASDQAALGARAAILARGLDLGKAIGLNCTGSDKRVLDAILNGQIIGTVNPNPRVAAETAIRASYTLAAKGNVEPKLFVTPQQVTKANAQEVLKELYP